MNNIKTIENGRPVGGDYFSLFYLRSSNKNLKDFLNLFNFEDYWCYKYTLTQKPINYQQFLEFKYCGYIFFKKDMYNKENIDLWIEFIRQATIRVFYLVNPTPPFNPNKIKIRK